MFSKLPIYNMANRRTKTSTNPLAYDIFIVDDDDVTKQKLLYRAYWQNTDGFTAAHLKKMTKQKLLQCILYKNEEWAPLNALSENQTSASKSYMKQLSKAH